MKDKALANHLIENSHNCDFEPLDTYFPDEAINSTEEVTSEGN